MPKMKPTKVSVFLCSDECDFCIDLEAVGSGQGCLCNKGTPAPCFPDDGICGHKPNALGDMGLGVSSQIAIAESTDPAAPANPTPNDLS